MIRKNTKKISKKLTIIIFILCRIVINIISIFLKPKRNIWLFGSWYGMKYSDNPRVLYEFMNKNRNKHNVNTLVWVTKSKDLKEELQSIGINSVYYTSLQSIYYHIFASNYIYSQSLEADFNKYFINKSLKTNLWHGFPLKKIGQIFKNSKAKDNIYRKITKFLTYREQHFICFSKLYKDLIIQAFDVDTNNVIDGPSVRTIYKIEHYLKDEMDLRSDLICKKKLNKKIVFYLPTFRDTKKDKFLNSNRKDISKFVKSCDNNDIVFLTKGHFADTGGDFYCLDGLIRIKDSVDISSVLDLCDILITDYSSVYFDYLYYNKPIIFYPYDLDYYCNSDRGLIFDYKEITPGDKVENINELLPAIINNICKDNFINERHKLKSLIFDNNYTLSDLVKILDKRVTL